MLFEPGILVTLGLTGIAGIVWAVRTEGRITTHDSLFVEREKQADDRYEDLKNRLVRIEGKLDGPAYPPTRRKRS